MSPDRTKALARLGATIELRNIKGTFEGQAVMFPRHGVLDEMSRGTVTCAAGYQARVRDDESGESKWFHIDDLRVEVVISEEKAP